MRVATFMIAGERRVGLVDLDRDIVTPFDLPVDVAHEGVVALIKRNGAASGDVVADIFGACRD
jgi:hypothetical protein